jgi:hypothetical protein
MGLVAAGCGDDGDDGTSEEEITFTHETSSDIPCELASKGLELLAEHVHEGESVATILAATVVPVGCSYLVKTLVQQPYETVSVEVDLPTNETTYFNGSGEELIEPTAPPPAEPDPEIDIGRLIDCVQSYSIQFLVDECYDGNIEP